MESPARAVIGTGSKPSSINERVCASRFARFTMLARTPPGALPGWPRLLAPQQYVIPVVVTPHVECHPALSVAKANPRATGTGVGVTSPFGLSPQQYTAPVGVRPQALESPLVVSEARVSPPAT